MSTSVYVCSWRTGAVTFFVERTRHNDRRVITYRWDGRGSSQRDVLVKRALAELKNHLDGTQLPIPLDDRTAGVRFVWFPSLEGRRDHRAS